MLWRSPIEEVTTNGAANELQGVTYTKGDDWIEADWPRPGSANIVRCQLAFVDNNGSVIGGSGYHTPAEHGAAFGSTSNYHFQLKVAGLTPATTYKCRVIYEDA